jgi:hypothetical protein
VRRKLIGKDVIQCKMDQNGDASRYLPPLNPYRNSRLEPAASVATLLELRPSLLAPPRGSSFATASGSAAASTPPSSNNLLPGWGNGPATRTEKSMTPSNTSAAAPQPAESAPRASFKMKRTGHSDLFPGDGPVPPKPKQSASVVPQKRSLPPSLLSEPLPPLAPGLNTLHRNKRLDPGLDKTQGVETSDGAQQTRAAMAVQPPGLATHLHQETNLQGSEPEPGSEEESDSGSDSGMSEDEDSRGPDTSTPVQLDIRNAANVPKPSKDDKPSTRRFSRRQRNLAETSGVQETLDTIESPDFGLLVETDQDSTRALSLASPGRPYHMWRGKTKKHASLQRYLGRYWLSTKFWSSGG